MLRAGHPVNIKNMCEKIFSCCGPQHGSVYLLPIPAGSSVEMTGQEKQLT